MSHSSQSSTLASHTILAKDFSYFFRPGRPQHVVAFEKHEEKLFVLMYFTPQYLQLHHFLIFW
jgi:hypothetical protein